jgi:cytosine deaminase
MDLENIKVRIAAYASAYSQSELKWHYRCCELALQALEQGNYGVGAVLINNDGFLVAEANNQVFSEGFDSSAHAEMRVIDQLERSLNDSSLIKSGMKNSETDLERPKTINRQALTLIVSLEPCPMCSCRIFASGIGQVIYMSRDKNGGMISHCNNLPPAWINLSQLAVIKQFNEKHELAVLAQDIASAHIQGLREKLITTIRE